MKRLTALVGLGAAVLAVLGANTATASAADPPPNDTEALSCLTFVQGMGDNCLAVSVHGAISNGVMTASAYVRPYSANQVARLQIDKLVVGAQYHTVLSTGPVNNGNKAQVNQSGTATLQYPTSCVLRYHAYVYFSARMSDGRVLRDSVASSTIDNTYGPCAGPTVIDKRVTTHCLDGTNAYACAPQGVQLVASNDGKRVYGRGYLALSSLDPKMSRVSINRVDLVRDGKVVAHAGAVNSGDLRPQNQPRTEDQTSGVLLPTGCATYQVKMSYSVRYSDGHLYTNTWDSTPYKHC
jgi:hypothetical protein